jgi:hypothetical protein
MVLNCFISWWFLFLPLLSWILLFNGRHLIDHIRCGGSIRLKKWKKFVQTGCRNKGSKMESWLRSRFVKWQDTRTTWRRSWWWKWHQLLVDGVLFSTELGRILVVLSTRCCCAWNSFWDAIGRSDGIAGSYRGIASPKCGQTYRLSLGGWREGHLSWCCCWR